MENKFLYKYINITLKLHIFKEIDLNLKEFDMIQLNEYLSFFFQ